MVLYATLGVCGLGAALLVYRYDLYDREPWPLLLLAIALGAAAMPMAGIAEDRVLAGARITGPAAVAALAALIEELARLAVVALLALAARRAFNDPMDGLVYGSMVGLGMAIEESVFYLGGSPARVLPPEELVRIAGHLVMGGVGGFGVGMARLGMAGAPLAVAAGLGAASLLHFGWDWLTLGAGPRGLSARETVLGVGLMLGGMGVYGTLVTIGSRWSQVRFAPGFPRSLWGWPFVRRRGVPAQGPPASS